MLSDCFFCLFVGPVTVYTLRLVNPGVILGAKPLRKAVKRSVSPCQCFSSPVKRCGGFDCGVELYPPGNYTPVN